MLNKILNKINSSKLKKRTLNSILEKEQKNYNVINVHRLNPNNVGDFYCAPHNYFHNLENSELDIFDYKSNSEIVRNNFINKISNNKLIVGGGGLLNRGSFHRQMKLFEELAQNGKKIVIWGVGHNEKKKSKYGKAQNYNIDHKKFNLFATRDQNLPGEYVPCVSCLNKVFDNKYDEKRDFGIVFHSKTYKKSSIKNKFKNIPYTSNSTDLNSLVKFIGESEGIITDSYHAMYWSFLLNKKVVVIPNSSKFFDFHLKPVFSNFDDCIKDLNKSKTLYSSPLEECRELNIQFAKKAFEYLEI